MEPSVAALLHRRQNHLPVGLERLRSELKSTSVLPHSRKYNLPVTLERTGSELESCPGPLHCHKHHAPIRTKHRKPELEPVLSNGLKHNLPVLRELARSQVESGEAAKTTFLSARSRKNCSANPAWRTAVRTTSRCARKASEANSSANPF